MNNDEREYCDICGGISMKERIKEIEEKEKKRKRKAMKKNKENKPTPKKEQSDWVKHVKSFSKENNMTYKEAMQDKKCKNLYYCAVCKKTTPKLTLKDREAQWRAEEIRKYGRKLN